MHGGVCILLVLKQTKEKNTFNFPLIKSGKDHFQKKKNYTAITMMRRWFQSRT